MEKTPRLSCGDHTPCAPRRHHSTQRLAFLNMCSHGLSSPHSAGCQLICTVRKTRSGCGIMMAKRPSAVRSAFRGRFRSAGRCCRSNAVTKAPYPDRRHDPRLPCPRRARRRWECASLPCRRRRARAVKLRQPCGQPRNLQAARARLSRNDQATTRLFFCPWAISSVRRILAPA